MYNTRLISETLFPSIPSFCIINSAQWNAERIYDMSIKERKGKDKKISNLQTYWELKKMEYPDIFRNVKDIYQWFPVSGIPSIWYYRVRKDLPNRRHSYFAAGTSWYWFSYSILNWKMRKLLILEIIFCYQSHQHSQLYQHQKHVLLNK